MKSKLFALLLMSLVIVGLLAESGNITQASQKTGDLEVDKNPNHKVTVVRKPKLGRKTVRRKPAPQKVSLLALEYRIFKQDTNLLPIEVDPATVFTNGDRLQIKIKPNQSGYLYIIQRNEGDREGQIIFPDSQINKGESFIQKGLEFTLPSKCGKLTDRNGNCWFGIEPPASSELFTVVFSRDLVIELAERARAGGKVPLSFIDQLAKDSKPYIKRVGKPHTGRGTGREGRYAVLVINTNTKDNEELVADIVLNHQ